MTTKPSNTDYATLGYNYNSNVETGLDDVQRHDPTQYRKQRIDESTENILQAFGRLGYEPAYPHVFEEGSDPAENRRFMLLEIKAASEAAFEDEDPANSDVLSILNKNATDYMLASSLNEFAHSETAAALHNKLGNVSYIDQLHSLRTVENIEELKLSHARSSISDLITSVQIGETKDATATKALSDHVLRHDTELLRIIKRNETGTNDHTMSDRSFTEEERQSAIDAIHHAIDRKARHDAAGWGSGSADHQKAINSSIEGMIESLENDRYLSFIQSGRTMADAYHDYNTMLIDKQNAPPPQKRYMGNHARKDYYQLVANYIGV